MPVVAEKNLVGMVSLRDLAFWRMENIEDEKNKALHSEQGYWDFIKKSPDATYVEIDGRIVFANEKATHLFAAESAENLIDSHTEPLCPRSFEDILQERGRLGLANGDWLPFIEVAYPRLDGTPFIGEWTGTTIMWRGETAILHVVRNRPDRKSPGETASRTNHRVREGIDWSDGERPPLGNGRPLIRSKPNRCD